MPEIFSSIDTLFLFPNMGGVHILTHRNGTYMGSFANSSGAQQWCAKNGYLMEETTGRAKFFK